MLLAHLVYGLVVRFFRAFLFSVIIVHCQRNHCFVDPLISQKIEHCRVELSGFVDLRKMVRLINDVKPDVAHSFNSCLSIGNGIDAILPTPYN